MGLVRLNTTPYTHRSISVRMLADIFSKFGLNPDKRNKLGYTPLLLACKCGNYVSAYTLVTVTRASPTLRDGEFHLNATEWIQRTHQIQVSLRGTHPRKVSLLNTHPDADQLF